MGTPTRVYDKTILLHNHLFAVDDNKTEQKSSSSISSGSTKSSTTVQPSSTPVPPNEKPAVPAEKPETPKEKSEDKSAPAEKPADKPAPAQKGREDEDFRLSWKLLKEGENITMKLDPLTQKYKFHVSHGSALGQIN